MSYHTYCKSIWRTFLASKARFLSMTSLMALGAFALVGLQVTPTNMEKTAQAYIDKTNMMDLAVIASHGFSDTDKKELANLPNSQLDYTYLTDVTIKGKRDVIRLFSMPKTISHFQLVKGQFPTKSSEIALDKELMTTYQIGDSIDLTSQNKGVSQLSGERFIIAGFVTAADMWFSDNYGESQEGDGRLKAIGVLLPEAFTSPTESLLKIRFSDISGLSYHDTAYQEKIHSYQKTVEELLKDNGRARFTEIQKNMETSLQQAKTDLSGAETSLQNHQDILDRKQNELQVGKDATEKAKAILAQEKNKLTTSYEELKRQEELLTSIKGSLDHTKQELDTTKFILDNTKSQLNQIYVGVVQEEEQLTSTKQDLDDLAAQISSEQASLSQDMMTYQEEGSASGLTALDLEWRANALVKQSQDYQARFENYQTAYETYQSCLGDYQNRLNQYHQSFHTYQDSFTIYEKGLADYEASLAHLTEAKKELDGGQTAIITSLLEKEQTLTEGQVQLDKAKQEVATKTNGATKVIKEGQDKIAEAEKQLMTLSEPTYQVYDRVHFPGAYGYQVYQTATNNIATVSRIFPLVLYLVAVLVTLTTMTRFADEERQQAGILKALGYSHQQVMAKFLGYALITSLLGTVIGSLAGFYILSPMVANLLAPSVLGNSLLHFQLDVMILPLLLAFMSTILPTILIVRRDLNVRTAELLQAKPPVQGASILLEKIGFLWHKLTFTQKVTARNIFRYKQRLLMTVFGVAGSVALLFTGLGIRSSISGVSHRQYQELIRYDLFLVQKDKLTSEEKQDLKSYLEKDIEILDFQTIQLQKAKVNVKDQEENVNLIISDKPFTSFVQLVNRETGEELSLLEDSAIITEKLARLTHTKIGDNLTISIGQKDYSIVIGGITEHYAGHSLYLSKNAYHHLTTNPYLPNAYFIKGENLTKKQLSSLAQKLLAREEVEAVIQNTQLVKQLTGLANSLQSVMILLVLVATILAFVILYNLTNINLAERVRELSTIKVLGFHDKEVSLYLYRETMMLSFVGIVIGLIAGYHMHQIIIGQIGSNHIMFNPRVSLEVYLIPFVIILIILIVMWYWIHHKLKSLDMLDALKSVD